MCTECARGYTVTVGEHTYAALGQSGPCWALALAGPKSVAGDSTLLIVPADSGIKPVPRSNLFPNRMTRIELTVAHDATHRHIVH
jgi:hypothetical protein